MVDDFEMVAIRSIDAEDGIGAASKFLLMREQGTHRKIYKCSGASCCENLLLAKLCGLTCFGSIESQTV